jgi:hypothetical protein
MSNTIIKDPVMGPFHLSKDQYCYTIVETITPEEKNLGRFGNKGNKNEGKNYEKNISHHSTLGSALGKIAKMRLDAKQDYDSIKDYLKEFEIQKEEMKQLLTQIGI